MSKSQSAMSDLKVQAASEADADAEADAGTDADSEAESESSSSESPTSPAWRKLSNFGGKITTLIASHPLAAVGVALTLGFVVGRLIRR